MGSRMATTSWYLTNQFFIYSSIKKIYVMGQSLEDAYKKIQERIANERISREESEKAENEIREKARQEYLKRNRMYESFSNASSVASSAAGGMNSVPSWKTIINTAYLYPHLQVDTTIEEYKGLSPSVVQNGNVLKFSNINHLFQFYDEVVTKTIYAQPIGNAGYSLGVGTVLKDLGETLYLDLANGLRIITWRLVEQVTSQSDVPVGGNSPDRTIGFVPIYVDWNEDGEQDPTDTNIYNPYVAFGQNADPLRVQSNGLIKRNA